MDTWRKLWRRDLMAMTVFAVMGGICGFFDAWALSVSCFIGAVCFFVIFMFTYLTPPVDSDG